MNNFRTLADIRRDYGELHLSESSISLDPMKQFTLWFEEILQQEKNDPTAMVLSTVDEKGHPDSRVVLLKALHQGRFVFYTNYSSAKAVQIQKNPHVAINFYWPQMARQVRIRGCIKKVSSEQSDRYFASRPVKSQMSALLSPQSQVIPDRQFLEDALNDLILTIQGPLPRPKHWGGYEILPDEMEFWQGCNNRLHDRIHYYQQEGKWVHRRLAP